jgi:hypothetical protein
MHSGGPGCNNDLQSASANAVSGILAALNDEEAAALILRSCRQRSGLQSILLQKLPALNDITENTASVEPRKRACRRFITAPKEFPRPGANGGTYFEMAVYLLSGRLAATVNVYGKDLVAVLKAEIQRFEGTPVWQQQLLIDDCPLEDQEMLESYVFPEMRKESGRVYVTMHRRDLFIPAAACQESRPGYSFREGEHGVGYYADDPDSSPNSC